MQTNREEKQDENKKLEYHELRYQPNFINYTATFISALSTAGAIDNSLNGDFSQGVLAGFLGGLFGVLQFIPFYRNE